MEKLMNTVINKTMVANLSTENIISFEVNELKNINFSNSDILMIDLAELVDMNPVNISECEKQMIAIFLDKLLVDLESKVVINITTTPHELACFFLTVIRSIPKLETFLSS